MKPEAELKKLTEIPSNNNTYCKRNSDLEDVEKRDLFSKNFNCHNRTRKTVIFGSPIHYLNTATNKYEDIDLSLKTNEDSVFNDSNGFRTVFNKNAKSNSVFEISKNNYTISLKLVNQNGTKGEEKSYNKQVNDGSKFVVKNDDIEYNYKVLNNKVKDELSDIKKFGFRSNGRSEGKYFWGTESGVNKYSAWANQTDVVGIRVSKSFVNNTVTCWSNLDGYGKAYFFSDIDYLYKVLKGLWFF